MNQGERGDRVIGHETQSAKQISNHGYSIENKKLVKKERVDLVYHMAQPRRALTGHKNINPDMDPTKLGGGGAYWEDGRGQESTNVQGRRRQSETTMPFPAMHR